MTSTAPDAPTATAAPRNRRVLVLGAYGLIGQAVCTALENSGRRVIACGRAHAMAARILPNLPFRQADVARMSPGDWAALLDGTDAVVNCAGALQDGPNDDLEALHHHALTHLGQTAATTGTTVVQISAAGATPEAMTAFLASKARGDAALLASGATAYVLRPGLVIAQSAYGGSLLLRMLAAVPWVQPQALPDTPIQTVDVSEIARATCRALDGNLPQNSTWDLVEDSARPLSEVITLHRAALGFAPARARLTLPARLLPIVGRCADALGRLGWRSPLRRTALTVLQSGVTGDPAPWRARFGLLAPLTTTLTKARLGAEHRLQARAALAMPIAVATLALFWALSGAIGLVSIDAAARTLTETGWTHVSAKAAVVFWSLVDLALAAAILYRPWATRACAGMVGVSAIYLASATLITPHLWADPLGPLVKILPAMLLAALTPMLLQSR